MYMEIGTEPDRNFEKIVAGLVMEWKFEIFEKVFSVHGEMSEFVEKIVKR